MLPQQPIESVILLSAHLVEKNKAFTAALKGKRPQTELRVIHSEIQEIYNHITFLNAGKQKITIQGMTA
jgi:hypothetical protein